MPHTVTTRLLAAAIALTLTPSALAAPLPSAPLPSEIDTSAPPQTRELTSSNPDAEPSAEPSIDWSSRFLSEVQAAQQAASAAWQTLLQNPTSAQAHRALADTLQKLYRDTEAETHYQQAIRLSAQEDQTNEQTDEQTYLAYIDFLFLRGRSEKAKDLTKVFATVMPNSAIAQLKLAYTLDNIYTLNIPAEQQQAAETAYRTAVELAPEEASFHKALGDHLARQNRLDEAAAVYRKVIRLTADVPTYQALANIAEEKGDLAGVEAIYRAAIAAQPTNLRTYSLLANWLESHNRAAEVEALYTNAIEQLPEVADLYHTLGLRLLRTGREQDAEAVFRTALQRSVGDVSIFQGLLASALEKQGSNEAAETAYKEAIALSPNAYTYGQLGDFLERTKGTNAAIALYQQAIIDLPTEDHLYVMLGRLLEQNGETKAAIATYRSALSTSALSTSALSTIEHSRNALPLAKLLVEQARYAEAEEIYQQFGVLFSETSGTISRWEATLRALGKTDAANNLENYIKVQQAAAKEPTYREAVRISPKSGYYHDLLGDVLVIQAKAAEAETAYRDALQLGYAPFRTTTKLGKAQFDQGHINQAETTYETALAMIPERDRDTQIYGLSELYQHLGEAYIARGERLAALRLYRKALAIDPYTSGISETIRALLNERPQTSAKSAP